jgi:hypothetical protein
VALGERFVLFMGGWDQDEEESGVKHVHASAAHARLQAKKQAGGTAAPVNIAEPPAYEAAGGHNAGDPFGDVWLLDTRVGLDNESEEWEWIRVEPTVHATPPIGAAGSSSGASVDAATAAAKTYGSYLRTHLARAGHSALLVPDVRGLIGLTLLQPSSKGGVGMDANGRQALLLPPTAEIQGAIPGIVLFGGIRPQSTAEDGSTVLAQSKDVVVLALPPALLQAGNAIEVAVQRASLEYEELAAAAQDEGQAGAGAGAGAGSSVSEAPLPYAQVSMPIPSHGPFSPSPRTTAGPAMGAESSMPFPSLSQIPLSQASAGYGAQPAGLGLGLGSGMDVGMGMDHGEGADWDMVISMEQETGGPGYSQV